MKHNMKLFSLITVVALFLSAWAAQTAQSAAGTSTDSDESIELGSTSTGGAVVDDPLTSGSTTGVPTISDLDQLLGRVNLHPEIVASTTTDQIAPPEPGSESTVEGPLEPKPLPPMASSDQSQSNTASVKAVTSSIQSIGEWLLALVRSLFNS